MGAKGNVKDNVPAEVGEAPKQTLPNIIIFFSPFYLSNKVPFPVIKKKVTLWEE